LEALEDRCLFSAGALDTTFGVGGKVMTNFLGPTNDFGYGGTVIQPDGKIIEAGYSYTSSFPSGGGGAALVRYNPDGTLDMTFGTGGKVIPDYTKVGGAIRAVALQGDGKIVIAGETELISAGDFLVMRYNSDGSLDTSFGSGGMVATSFGTTSSFANAVAIQSDGKIVAAGSGFTQTGDRDFALARYNSDGTLDTSFGTGGEVTTAITGLTFSTAYSLAIQGDGRIVAAGSGFTQTFDSDFALARYNTSGSLDTTFGTGGEVTTNVAGVFQQAFSVAIQANGDIVAAGFAGTFTGGFEVADFFALARYNPNGSLDTTFGSGGKVTTSFGAFAFGRAVTIQTDGKIVAAGEDFSLDFLLARYNTDGSLDTSFGTGGEVVTHFGRNPAVALQSDGKIVAAGLAFLPATGFDFGVARYTTNGALDTTFGTGGEVTTNIGQAPTNDFGGGVAIQADGKLVVAGRAEVYFSDAENFALARYNSNGSLDTTFGTGGEVITSFPGRASQATSEAIQADGKIVLAGIARGGSDFHDSDFALARYNTNGSLDTSFGSGGEVVTDLGPFDEAASSIAIQPDGKIVVAGGSFGSFALVRYNTDGSLDTSFGTGGEAFARVNGEAAGVALQADGEIVAAGSSFVSGVGFEFTLVRFNTSGSIDTTFGAGGEVLTSFGGSLGSEARGVAIQDDGKIVAAGASRQPKIGGEFALARYNSDGSPDKSFGKNGQVLTAFGGGDDLCFSLALQGDGKIIAAGESYQPSSNQFDFALARYIPDGSLDQAFGNSGLVITDFGGGFPGSQALGVAIQADGNIVAAGTAFQNGHFDFAIARYIGVSPSQAIDAIISNVQGLVTSGVLNNGQGDALLIKLQHAIQHLDDGATATAVNDLQAFVNEVNDFVTQNVLTSALGQPLIDEADALIVLFGKK
jgi:uncharacterized delta-60 repeat protein